MFKMWQGMLVEVKMIGVLIFVLISFLISLLLVYVHQLLNRKEMVLENIKSMLPGYNCGACGFSSCSGMSEQLIDNPSVLKKCKPIKKEEYDKLMKYLKSRK